MLQQQQPQSQMPAQAYANYAIGSTGKFLLQSCASHQFLMSCVGVCYGVCFLLLGYHVPAMFTNGAQPLEFATL